MPEEMPAGGRSGQQSAERLPHHISSIAHLFFADDQAVGPVSSADTTREFAITSFNDSRISAFACAGLVTGSRALAADGVAWGVCLQEHMGAPWSSGSFLPGSATAQEASCALTGSDALCWTWRPASADQKSDSWVRWNHLEPGWDEKRNPPLPQGSPASPVTENTPSRDRPVSPHTLVVCLLVREMSRWETAFRLGRLLGLLEPQQLEILVFPDSWAPDTKADWPRRLWNDRELGGGGDLLTKCRNLTRAIAGACEMTITALPGGETAGGDVTPTVILEKIAARLTVDI